jgi:hypothetical protein
MIYLHINITRGGEVVSHQAHNLKTGGAIPSPASKQLKEQNESKSKTYFSTNTKRGS